MSKSKDLVLNQVTKQYHAGNVVFRDIDMRIRPGEALLLTGPNGSGKTTFLKILSINTFPTRGTVFYGELEIHREPHRYLKSVGLVHEEESLPQHLSALELLEWILRSRGQWDERSASNMKQLLDRLELGEARRDEIGTYSTGMKKKAQIAAATIIQPEILILDEPLRGLDESSTAGALELFKSEVERGAILLMASHSKLEAAAGSFKREIRFPL